MSLFRKKETEAEKLVTPPEHDASTGTAADVEAVMRKYDRESNTRIWEGAPKWIISALMAVFSLYCIIDTVFLTTLTEIRLPVFMGLILLLGFLTFPAKKGESRVNHLPWYDVLLILCGSGAYFFYAVNAEGTRRLAATLVELGLLAGRFVFMSSLSIFGPAREERVSASSPHYAPIRTTDTPRPDTDYGQSKLQAERSLAAIDGLDYVVLRPTGVYGPRERDYYLMARSIARHVDFAVGYRPQEITFVFVRDLAEAVVLACLRGKRGAAYFVTDGGVYDSRTFSRLLQRAMGVRGVVRVTAPVALLRLSWSKRIPHPAAAQLAV